MKIAELVENVEVTEGPILNKIGSAVGTGVGTAAKAAGAVAGGIAGIGSAFKKGFQSSKSTVSAAGDAPATVDAEQLKAQIAQKQQELKTLQSQLAKAQPGIGQASNTVSATATNTPAAQQTDQGVAPQAETPPTEPGIGQATNTVASTASNTEKPAAQPAAPSPEEIRKQKQAAAAQVAQAQMAANPVPTQKPAAPATNKPSPDAIKQAQLKKSLQKNQQARAAGQQPGGGFSASGVGQPRQRIYTKQGGDVGSYVVRENAEFYSKFLGKKI